MYSKESVQKYDPGPKKEPKENGACILSKLMKKIHATYQQ
jgi:hypothetical protein